MKLEITPKADQWLREELELTPEKKVRFFGKYGGKTEVHDGFSVGLSIDEPIDPLVELTLNGQTYFIDESDEWFFHDYDMKVDVDASGEDIQFIFKESV